MKLHDAIIKVLETSKRSMTVKEISEQLNLNNWYQKKDGSSVSAFQVHGRTKNYGHLFRRNGQEVSLHISNKIQTKNVALTKEIKGNLVTGPATFDPNVFERYLLNEIYFKSADLVDDLVPSGKRGIYCIKINSLRSLPEPFRKLLADKNHDILYIGIAEKCLNTRLLNQELRAKGHGTFIRSLGAILGYRPETGSLNNKKNKRNYTFSSPDKQRIINWFNRNLLVNWIEYNGKLKKVEDVLIKKVQPLLNITKNKSALAELKELRSECIKVANLKSI